MKKPIKPIKKRRTYDQNFKDSAVRLVLSGRNPTDVSISLGMNLNILHRWKREYLEKNKSELDERDIELELIKKKLLDTELERDILKKALSIFSRSM